MSGRRHGSRMPSVRGIFKVTRSSGSGSRGSGGSQDSQYNIRRNGSLASSQGEGMVKGLLDAKKRRGEEKLHKRRREVFDTPLEVVSRKGTLLSRLRQFNIPTIKKDANSEELIREALNRNIVLADLSAKDLQTVINAMKVKKVPSKTTLIKQGDNGDNFYVVQKGCFFYKKDGQTVGTAYPGESFGELALLYNVTRAVTVVSTEDSVVWQLDRDTFRKIMITSNYKKTQMIKEYLAKVPLFSGFTEQQIEKLSESVELLNFKKDTLIIEKGSEGSVIYFLKQGSVKCTRIGEETGVDIILDQPGDHFGERALMTEHERAADVIAHTDVECFALDREAFESIFGPLQDVLQRNLALRVLKSVPILHDLEETRLETLMQHLGEEKFKKDETIIQQGVMGEKFFIIQAGKVEILKHTKGVGNAPETTVKVTELQTGDYFGEGSLLNSTKTNAEVKAMTDVSLFSLSHVDFKRLLDTVQGKIEKHFRQRQRETEGELTRKVDNLEAGIEFKDLEALRVLGRGTFGVVKIVQHRKWKTTYGLKILQKDQIVKFKQQKNIMNEKNVMIKSRHPFILKLYKTFKDDDCLYMLLEFIQGGELFTLLQNHGGRISGRRSRFYASCVLDALLYLHDFEIIYRDLKPENLLIDAEGYIRVVDFGFAKKVSSKTYTLCGTPEYLAPELVQQKGHDRSIDYWALGILIYEMLEGRSPFTDPHIVPDDEAEYQKLVFNNIIRGEFEFTERFSSAAKSIVRKLLRLHPAERLGMGVGGGDDIRNHKWFKDINFDALCAKTVEAPWVPELSGPTDTRYFDIDEYDNQLEIKKYSVDKKDNWDKDF